MPLIGNSKIIMSLGGRLEKEDLLKFTLDDVPSLENFGLSKQCKRATLTQNSSALK